MSKADAITMAGAFATGAPSSAFPTLGVTRAVFAAALRDRVIAPELIDQGSSSLCGPAAFMFLLARKNPMAYASYVINLYEKGSAWIGKLKVEPGSDCKSYKPGGIHAVDWVALASLRDSSNAFFDYQSSSNELAGITMPGAVKAWFDRCGYFTGSVNDTNLVIDKGLSTLLKAHQKRAAGGSACLLIGATILRARPKGGDVVPDHWVVLGSDVKVDGKPVAPLITRGTAVDSDTALLAKTLSFSMFTWGGWLSLPRMSVSQFLDYFYGYVGVK